MQLMRWTGVILGGLVLTASIARAQVTANPNQIVGRLRFTNADPAVVAILSGPEQLGMAGSIVTATSQAPAAPSSHLADATAGSRTDAAYEISVEASSSGSVYLIDPVVTCGAGDSSFCFGGLLSEPVFPEPSPDIILDFSACVAIVDVRFVTSAGDPASVRDSTLSFLPAAPASDCGAASTFFRGGTHFQAHAVVPSGRSGDSLLVQYSAHARSWSTTISFPGGLACDTITPVEVIVPDPPARNGTIVGRFDILGYEEYTAGEAPSGSWMPLARVTELPSGDSYSYQWATGIPPSREEYRFDEIEALDSGKGYYLWMETMLQNGGRWTRARTPLLNLALHTNETLDLGDAFVQRPNRLFGTMALTGPRRSGGRASLLEFVCETTGGDDWRRISHISIEQGEGSVLSAYDGFFVPEASRYDGYFDLPLPRVNHDIQNWGLSASWLMIKASEADAGRHADIDIRIAPRISPAPLDDWYFADGDEARLDYAYCMSEVRVDFTSSTGTFFAPRVDVAGTFNGIDFLGASKRYSTAGGAKGTPLALEQAAAMGSVVLLLPQGNYAMTPTMTSVNPGGGTTMTTLPTFNLQVGCRQTIVARGEVQVALDADLPRCSAGTTVNITGTASSADGIARLYHVEPGGPEVDICLSCGTSFAFDFPALLPVIDPSVRVVAQSALGAQAEVEARAPMLEEPSALETNPSALPLTVTKPSASLFELKWEPLPEETFNVYAGTLLSLWRDRTYDHVGQRPCLLATGAASVAMPAANTYWLVTGVCASGESSCGQDSFGRERPAGAGCP